VVSQPGFGIVGDVTDNDTREPLSNRELKELVKVMLAREGGITGIVVSVAPTVVFFVVNALSSLRPALITAVVTAVLAVGWQSIRRQPLRPAIVGFVIVAASAGVAAMVGQAKGFFLITTAAGGVLSAALFVSVLAGYPLAAVLLNRIAGGRSDWRRDRRRMRIYSVMTLVWGVVHGLWFALHVWFYLANLTGGLAALSVTGPPLIIGTLVVSAVVARRAVGRERAAASPRQAGHASAAFLERHTQNADDRSVVWAGVVPRSRAGRGR
jgi:Protein of unknown function (DUF3159)